MILDSFLALDSTPQDYTDSDAYTTNTIDLQAAGIDFGEGEPMSLVFHITTAAAGSTDTTDLMAVNSANANLSSHVAIVTRRVANALLVAGAIVEIPIPHDLAPLEYFGGRIELGSGDTVSAEAYLVPSSEVKSFTAYASGYTVS